MKKSKFRIALGAAIRERRKQLGLSQDAFADLVGLHRTYIGGIERGERNLALDNLERISSALAIPMSALMGMAESTIIEKDSYNGSTERFKSSGS
jgi:transcriptional regulator with XRE-family HTH domain